MGPWTDMIANNAEFSLADALDFTEGDFRSDFLEYWGLDASSAPDWMDHDQWLQLRKLHGFAAQISEIVSTLLKRKGVGPDRLAQPAILAQEAAFFQTQVNEALAFIEQKSGADAKWQAYSRLTPQAPSDPRTRRAVFRNSFELAISQLFMPDLGSMAQRAENLIEHLAAVPGERARAYLSRVARCYCLDQSTELAVMCRAVCDAALTDVAPDENVRKASGLRSSQRIGLSHRLNYVESLDLLPREVIDAMTRVKRAGDDAVHVSPGLEPERDVLLADLVVGLNGIAKLLH
jgi:hypothetical protein